MKTGSIEGPQNRKHSMLCPRRGPKMASRTVIQMRALEMQFSYPRRSFICLILVCNILAILVVYDNCPKSNLSKPEIATESVDSESGTYAFSSSNPLVSRTSNPPPPPPMTPPFRQGASSGWTMEQWHYYGEEYLSRYYPTEISKDK